MKNKGIEIFTDDIEIPAVVQRKADAAFAQIKKERAEAMKGEKRVKKTENRQNKVLKYTGPVVAAAACIVLAAGVGIVSRMGQNQSETVLEESSRDDMERPTPEKPVLEELVQGSMFTMTAYARELEPGKPVALTTNVGRSGNSCVLSGRKEEGTVSYCISTQFLCEGENIERVGYSINQGAFQIVQLVKPNEGIIVEGERYDGELNVGMIGGNFDESLDVQPDIYTSYYKSFLLDYDKQSDENTWINICGECPDNGEILELIWGEGAGLEEHNSGNNKLFGDTVITCTAYYTDGTTQSVDIAVGSRIMTYEEAGEFSGKDEIPGDTKSPFITFEVK